MTTITLTAVREELRQAVMRDGSHAFAQAHGLKHCDLIAALQDKGIPGKDALRAIGRRAVTVYVSAQTDSLPCHPAASGCVSSRKDKV